LASPRLDYGSSRFSPWIVRAEIVLGLLARDVKSGWRNWKRIALALTAVAIVLAAVVVLLAAGLSWLHAPRKIADIPGPSPAERPLEFWYGHSGDLMLSRWGGPTITMADYYGDLKVARVHWPAADRVIITMSDGSTLQYSIGWFATPPTTQRSP